ncbi:MAG: FKBP-type peptidyl-prolyl cis-trans isomerase [Bacteroidales bacterium]|nr:FKBP-type peptidyl-prolyl cis-trans isomerase [Bacteroidales bacterium]
MKVLKITYIALLFFPMLIGVLSSCQNNQTGTVVSDDKKEKVDKEAPYVEGNKKILQWENEEMELFIKRYQWDMQKTGTGLYIQILNPGAGDFFKEDDRVTMEYQTFLLTGEKIYDSQEDGPKTFTIAKSEEIAALHEAAQMLRPGAKARLVIPSYLAYGVAGDGNKVDGRLSIAMTIEIDKQP